MAFKFPFLISILKKKKEERKRSENTAVLGFQF